MFFQAARRPMYFAFHLKMSGDISVDDLKSALTSIRPKYPSTAVRVAFGPGKRQYITTEGVKDFPIEVLKPQTDWRSVVAQRLTDKFDDNIGPMVKFLLIQQRDTTSLIAIFHHAICDGISGANFLKALYRSLAAPQKNQCVCSPDSFGWEPVLTHCLKENIQKEFEQSELPDWIKHKLHLKIPIKPCPDEFHFLQPTFDIRTIELDENDTVRVQSVSKQWGVSVHSLLGAIMLSSFARRYARSTGYDRIIQSPVSFRHFLKEENRDAFGLFMGIIKEKIDCSPRCSIKDIASQIHTRFRVKINSTETLKHYLSFMTHMLDGVDDPESYFYSSPKHDHMDYDFSLSNLGRIDFGEESDKLRILQFHGPIFSAVDGERIFGVTTTNGRMTISMIYDNNLFCSKRAGEIFDEIEGSLRSVEKL